MATENSHLHRQDIVCSLLVQSISVLYGLWVFLAYHTTAHIVTNVFSLLYWGLKLGPHNAVQVFTITFSVFFMCFKTFCYRVLINFLGWAGTYNSEQLRLKLQLWILTEPLRWIMPTAICSTYISSFPQFNISVKQ